MKTIDQANKYKHYQRAKIKGSKPTESHKSSSSKTKQTAQQLAPEVIKRSEIYQTPKKAQDIPIPQRQAVEATPIPEEPKINELGPTPQINGRVLGLFDFETPFKTPIKSKPFPTPSMKSLKSLNDTECQPLGIFSSCDSKKSTPSLQFPTTPLSERSCNLPETPQYLHQKSSFSFIELSASKAVPDESDFSPAGPRKTRRRLSHMIAEFKSLQEEKLKSLPEKINEEKEQQTQEERENSRQTSPETDECITPTKNLSSPPSEPPSDSTPIPENDDNDGEKEKEGEEEHCENENKNNDEADDGLIPKNFFDSLDDEAALREFQDFDGLSEDNGPEGAATNTKYKKKGQKRTTKRHIFRPDVPVEYKKDDDSSASNRPVKPTQNFKRLKLNNSGYKNTPKFFGKRRK